MAKQSAMTVTPIPKVFSSTKEIESGIQKINRRIAQLEALKNEKACYTDPRIDNAESAIRETVLDVFGPQSPEFIEHQHHTIGHSYLVYADDEALQNRYILEDLGRSLVMMEGLRSRLEEKKQDFDDTDTGFASPSSCQPIDLGSLQPEIILKCQKLFEDGHFAEAVEKGFKVVKDRLRDLTSFEKGADAFGKGLLHIKGASAPNVDEDFNEGIKFLTMAIDRFRNEKSHTSDAKIHDPIRAYAYLQLSSLAMFLLETVLAPKTGEVETSKIAAYAPES